MKKTVYLSLGSNVGGRAANLAAAIERLRALGEITAVSCLYETEPLEFRSQPWFLNCAVALETELMPRQLLGRTQRIEQDMGRRRAASPRPAGRASALSRKGPRPIDIDILLFGRAVLDTAALVIPHPAMHRRRFVLEPLAEIAPGVRHPVFKLTVSQMRDNAAHSGQAVRKLSDRVIAGSGKAKVRETGSAGFLN
jgi:2-amino-4-hydroxy-6-hydroxymethyldihydropteridine diphosphokinase